MKLSKLKLNDRNPRIIKDAKFTQLVQSLKDFPKMMRLRPIIPGITDYKRGHIDLIKRAADAGARAVSYEVMFYPMAIPKANRPMNYLQGAVEIAGEDEQGNYIYRYVGLKRQKKDEK